MKVYVQNINIDNKETNMLELMYFFFRNFVKSVKKLKDILLNVYAC